MKTQEKINGERRAVNNGHRRTINGGDGANESNLDLILTCLRAMRDGDFSVRLPMSWTLVEGKIADTFKELVDDLVRPTTEMTRAIAAVAQGNLTQTVRLDVDGRPLQGEFHRSASIVNTMIQQLGVFTSEVTRVAREVGSEGRLGGQANVPGVAGTWKDLTESVNAMAGNLTAQVR